MSFRVFFTVLVGLVVAVQATQNAFHQLLVNKGLDFYNEAQRYMTDNNLEFSPTPDYPYFNFIPQLVNHMKVDGPKITWATSCFANNEAFVTRDGNMLNVAVTSSGALAEDCEDHYMTLCTSIIDRATPITTSGGDSIVSTVYSLTIPDDVTDAELWDIDNKGLRLMKYPTKSRGETVSNLIKTFEMFIPELTINIPTAVAEANIDFLNKYANKDYPARDPSESLPPPSHLVHSGDVLYVIRFDGLDPMLAWAMGSTTGHTTTAQWIDGELYICESTVADSYWPTDNIQKTPYETWLKQAKAAGFLVVWAPLTEEARSNYNETAAAEFFKANEGYSYGFQTMLWGWLDTPNGNWPCLPPDFSSNCATWDLFEPLLSYVDRNTNEIGDQMWNAGIAKRLGVEIQRTSNLLQEAANQGFENSVDVVLIPEDDNWEYNTTRYGEPAVGKAMVCCVYVCSSWKAAGVFGDLTDEINCGEQTNWDIYSMTVHAQGEEKQIIGEYKLSLNDYATRDLYASMGEKCDSSAPDYEKTEKC